MSESKSKRCEVDYLTFLPIDEKADVYVTHGDKCLLCDTVKQTATGDCWSEAAIDGLQTFFGVDAKELPLGDDRTKQENALWKQITARCGIKRPSCARREMALTMSPVNVKQVKANIGILKERLKKSKRLFSNALDYVNAYGQVALLYSKYADTALTKEIIQGPLSESVKKCMKANRQVKSHQIHTNVLHVLPITAATLINEWAHSSEKAFNQVKLYFNNQPADCVDKTIEQAFRILQSASSSSLGSSREEEKKTLKEKKKRKHKDENDQNRSKDTKKTRTNNVDSEETKETKATAVIPTKKLKTKKASPKQSPITRTFKQTKKVSKALKTAAKSRDETKETKETKEAKEAKEKQKAAAPGQSWNAFRLAHKKMGLSMRQLSELYAKQKSVLGKDVPSLD